MAAKSTQSGCNGHCLGHVAPVLRGEVNRNGKDKRRCMIDGCDKTRQGGGGWCCSSNIMQAQRDKQMNK